MAIYDSLVSYWKLDEASGNALDSHSTNHLTDVNTVGSAAGKINTARDFEADNSESMFIANNASLQTGDIDFTFTCWVKLESKPAAGRFFSKFGNSPSAPNLNEFALSYVGGGTDRFEWVVCESGGAVKFVDANTFGSPSLATWYFLMARYDHTNDLVQISVNDGTVDQTTGVAGPAATNAKLNFGCLNTAADATPIQFHDGLLDEIGYWKRLLTAGEVTRLYNGGNGLAYPFDPIVGRIYSFSQAVKAASIW